VLGATIITLLPELLRSFRDFRTMLNGTILVLIVLFLPKGIWDPVRFRSWFGCHGSRALDTAAVAPPASPHISRTPVKTRMAFPLDCPLVLVLKRNQ
jgi:hypothetical protein